jgi:hypothetical protein
MDSQFDELKEEVQTKKSNADILLNIESSLQSIVEIEDNKSSVHSVLVDSGSI